MRVFPQLRRNMRGRCGASAVEFAVVLPVLLILLSGILDIGRRLQVTQILTNAAREGARHGAADAPIADVEKVVRRYLINQGLDKVINSVIVACTTNGRTESGFPVYFVSVSVPMSAVQLPISLTRAVSPNLVVKTQWPRHE
jgi:Flp pilus assembly protein TadG